MKQALSRLKTPRIADALGLYLNHVVVDCVMPLSQAVDSTDTGCYVVIWRGIEVHGGLGVHWSPAVGMAVGDVTTEKFVKYLTFAHEKAARLATYPKHISSFESWDESDPANPRYPGAVRMDLENIIISCSGFGWKFDEMVGMQLGWHLRLVSSRRMNALIDLSDNEHAREHFTRAAMLGG